MSMADKLTAIAENVQKVYDAGYEKGKAAGSGGTDERFKELAEGTIEEINDDTITTARAYAFAYNKALKTATFNNLESIGTTAFGYCTALETVILPKLKDTGYTGFSGCAALKNVYLPIAGTNHGSFVNCSSLEFIDLPKCSYLNNATFQGCSSLKIIILRHNVRIYLENVAAFANTPFRNGEGGTIYVPQALVENYKTATNWNALESTTFLPIEGSEYE